MLIPKRDIIKAIKNHCENQCSSRNVKENCCKCSLSSFKDGEPKKGENQSDLFKMCDIDVFYASILKAADSFGGWPFWWSELRQRVKVPPVVDNWWSVSTRKLRKEGYEIIGSGKRSTIKSRCGAVERQWQRIGGQNENNR